MKSAIQSRLTFGACNCTFVLECDDDEIADFVGVAFEGLRSQVPRYIERPVGHYRIEREPVGAFRVLDTDGRSVVLEDADDVLFHIDKSLTIALQRLRPDLFFLHAAAVSRMGSAIVIPAPSGTGKSTLTLALARNGFAYLSDELAPIDVPTCSVQPFRHALCLKSPVLRPLCLPATTVHAGGRYHVPASALGDAADTSGGQIVAFIFPKRSERRFGCRLLSPAETVAHLMANALNPSAHANEGIDAAATLAQRVRAFRLDVSDLDRACAEIDRLFAAELPQPATAVESPAI